MYAALGESHRHEIDLPYDIDVIEYLKAGKMGVLRAQ